MNFSELVEKRYSCRSFLDKEIDKSILTKIIEIARLQPSAVNSQQYKFHVCTGESARKISKARGLYNKFIDNVPAFIVITEDRRNVVLKFAKLSDFNDFVPIDIGIVVASICYEAAELGVESCVLGLFKEKEVQEIINDNNKVSVIIALGYEKEENTRPKKRRNFDDICVFHN